jgi:7-cyano-7-deazaguanine reductase
MYKDNSFAEERSKKGKDSTRYGKNIISNFNVETDLVVWDIDNEFDQLVTFSHPEVIGRCPVSGYPDTYVAKFSFVTDKLTMELKAFKLWLNSYIDKQISHEYLAQEIFSIFWKKVEPKYLKVELLPAPRGNVTTTIVCEKYKDGCDYLKGNINE